MQKRPVVILIACGSGIATSTLAAQATKELCDELKIDVTIQKSNMNEVVSRAPYVDVIFTTNKYSADLQVPIISVTSFITGIGEEKTKKECTKVLMDIVSKL